jgi:hypothetical protein
VTGLERFWRGGVPLAEAFWVWGVLGGAVLNLFATLAAAMLLTFGAPAWLAAAAFAAPIPANIALLVGVWRSAGRPEVGQDKRLLARACMAVWAVVLSLV